MPFRAHGPEPCASAYSATRARPTGVGSLPRVQVWAIACAFERQTASSINEWACCRSSRTPWTGW
jgi:hypothetical protein